MTCALGQMLNESRIRRVMQPQGRLPNIILDYLMKHSFDYGSVVMSAPAQTPVVHPQQK